MAALRRFGPLLLVAALLAAAMVAAALATPQITHVPIPPRHHPAPPHLGAPGAKPALPTAGALGNAQGSTVLPGWLVGLGTALCLAAVAAVVGLIVWYLIRPALSARVGRLAVEDRAPATTTTRRDEVIAAVDAGLSGLDDDGDPRRVVIACWVRLEQAAAAAGTPRHPGDTPTDLVLRLLAGHEVSASALYPLADVYHRARYASHAVDTGMRDAARSALAQVRAELTAGVSRGTGCGVPHGTG